MSRAINHSLNQLGVRGQNGVLEALPFRAWIYLKDFCKEIGDLKDYYRHEGKIYRVEWRTLNLQSGEISETLSTMPPEARHFGTAVACGNRVYVLGGTCLGDPFCADKKCIGAHYNNCVFDFDCGSLDGKWKQSPPMLVPRCSPAAVATPRKIFVFGSIGRIVGPFAEAFNVELNRWDKLPDPPFASDLDFQDEPRVFFQSSQSRILVHFISHNSLQAFNLISESWECIDPNYPMFHNWSDISVIVDDVIYSLFEPPNCYWFDDFREHFRAYHLVEKKWLDVKWLCKSPVPAPSSIGEIKLFHLGKGRMCLVWYSASPKLINYIKFRVRFNSGEINASVENNGKKEETAIYATAEKNENNVSSKFCLKASILILCCCNEGSSC